MDNKFSSSPPPLKKLVCETVYLSAIMDAVKPAVMKLDEQVKNTRKSQLHLMEQMESLSQCEIPRFPDPLIPCLF